MTKARAMMIAGTASHVGKSVLCTALCRIFRQDGFRVAPFKAQNMALNSYPTRDGGEIGRAQVTQAMAAGIEPTVHMNPILLKPKRDTEAQVVVLGKPLGDMSAMTYRRDYLPVALGIVKDSLDRLRSEYDLVVMEGAGSIAEVNLKDRDIVNLRAAALADAPVVVAADIDRGGVFASIVGTMDLLDDAERRQIAGWVINKFRGDLSLFDPGVRFIEERTGRPVFGVMPFLTGLDIEEEDSVSLDETPGAGRQGPGDGPWLDIAVLKLPRISNFTDFDALIREPDVRLRYVEGLKELGSPDAVILPGTKNTVDDLRWLQETGLAVAAIRLSQRGCGVVGICGGYQMLGVELLDPDGHEADLPQLPGLGILPLVTTFTPEKITVRARGEILADRGFFGPLKGTVLEGYEIHMGRTTLLDGALPLLRLERGDADGAVADGGRVIGTYLHGLFDNDLFRRAWLNDLRRRKGALPIATAGESRLAREAAFDRLADAVREHLRVDEFYRLLGLPGPIGGRRP
ncbi:MAG: cobyric acid synthase [Bacillota bacterium]